MQNKMAVTITWFSVEPVQHLKWFMLVMCILAAYGDNPCEENIYLEVGTEGVVSCDFRDFVLLGWINGDENHEEASPFVYLESSQVKGRGYIDGNYDMQPDGSLIIKNVQLRNEANYTALYVPSFGPQVYFKVPVRVFVRPDPEYPVINGLNEQQYIVQDVMSSGAIECTLNGSRPGVPLEWVYQSDIITMDNELSSITPYNDDTFNTVLRSPFTIIRQSVTRVTVKCRTAGEYADLFPLATTIYLQLTRNYPTVNGQANQHLLIVELNRVDEITCSMSKVPQDILLQWVLPTEEPSGELMLQNETSTVNNEDGTANFTLTSRFSVLSPSIQRVTLQCRVSGQQAERYPDFTTAKILFTHNYPIVNGLVNQPHGVVEMNRNDELSCFMNRVPQDTLLQWVLPTEEPSGELMLQNETSTVNNEDGTANITLTSRFSVLSPSIRRVTLQCRVSGQQAERYPDFTVVDVLISESFPVVNGHNGEEHVVLHLKREDELTCSVNRVSQDVSLEWVIINPDVAEKIHLEDEHSKTRNEDGTFNVLLSSQFSVLSHTLQHVTMECRVVGLSADQYKEVTAIEVLITQSFPVVNGHNGEEHVVLHLKREDELTCSTNRVSQDVSLEWVIINPDVAEKIHLEDEHSKTRNEDGTFNILLRSQFSVLSHTLQHVTMECRVVGLSADQFKEVTTIEVLITQKSNTGPLPRPVIDGCYSQQEDCTLIVQQDGTLTCYVPNIPSEYTMNMSLDIFGDAGGIYFTRIKSYRHTHMCGDYDLTTSYQYTINEASTCAMSAIRCSLSGMDTSTLLTSSTASLIAFQDTMCSSEAIHEHRSVSNQMLVIYIILSLIVIELLFVTYTITRKIHQMQRQLVKLPSLLNGESQEEIVLQTELSSRNHSPNQTQINVMVSTDSLTPQLNTPLLERQNLGKESVRHSSDESGITSGTGSDTSKS